MNPPPLQLKDPRRYELERCIVKKATSLVKMNFSSQELAECSLSGTGGRRILDAEVLDGIRQQVMKEFTEQMPWLGDFNAVWQKCRNAISNMCKNMRSAILMRQTTYKYQITHNMNKMLD